MIARPRSCDGCAKRRALTQIRLLHRKVVATLGRWRQNGEDEHNVDELCNLENFLSCALDRTLCLEEARRVLQLTPEWYDAIVLPARNGSRPSPPRGLQRDFLFSVTPPSPPPPPSPSGIPRRSCTFVSYVKDGDFLERCAICLGRFDDGDRLTLLPCRHNFHQHCIGAHLDRGSLWCPLDRKPV